MQITIIYLEDHVLISKESFDGWRQIQDRYENYKTSLGPWSAEEVIDFLGDEYTKLNPSAEAQVRNLLCVNSKYQRLTFNE